MKPMTLAAPILFASCAMAAADIRFTQVFGPEQPGQYKHPASITQLANGDLYLAYYGGSGEYGRDTAVYGARQRTGEATWSTPRILADTPDRSEGNAVIWQAPDGKVWLFYLTRYGATWSTSRIKAKISTDGAKTWSDPLMLTFEEGTMIRSQPIVLHDGNYLLPIYHETGHDTEIVGPDSVSLFLRYDPKKKTWAETNRIRSRKGNIQPAVVQITDNDLISYSRRGGGYGPLTKGYLVRSESHDGGRTWAPGMDSQFPNPNAAADFIKLRNGHLLLVYNDSMTDRTPLTVAISTDADRTYAYKRDIRTGLGPFAYPYAIQTRDDKIHVVYTTHNRTVIEHAVFDERAILDSPRK